MSDNQRAKKQLIGLYGAECFIEKLHLRRDKERHYTGKNQYKKMKQLTYHHILEKRNGGRATVQNGAILSEENHQWFNRQPPKEQAKMNRLFQKYKHSVDCGIEYVDDLKIGFTVKTIIINFRESKKKFNRAKEKREVAKALDEFLNGERD